MNIPQELENVLNWKDNETAENKQPTSSEMDSNDYVDYYLRTIYPVYEHMIQFGTDYHNFMDNNDPAGLYAFIKKYKNDGYWRLARFANGLQKDIEAVKNTLLYPGISNGMTEGINNLIKSVKRVGGGKAKIDLLTAKIVIQQKDKEVMKKMGVA